MSMFFDHTYLHRPPKKPSNVVETPYNCEICDEGEWLSETEVEIHKKSKHAKYISKLFKDKNKYACMVCAKEHTSTTTLFQHIKTAHLFSSKDANYIEREIFICNHCGKLFFNKLLLQTHIYKRHPAHISKKSRLNCPKCYKTIKKLTMWSHFEQHHMSSIATCPICVEKCENRTEMQKHVDRHRRHYYCAICHYTTMIMENFHKHTARHREENAAKLEKQAIVKYFVPKRYAKYFVPKHYASQFLIQSAMKGLSLPNNVQICVVCRCICLDVAEMEEHVEMNHLPAEECKKPSYLCTCGQKFFNNVLLKQHIFKEKGDHGVMDAVKTE